MKLKLKLACVALVLALILPSCQSTSKVLDGTSWRKSTVNGDTREINTYTFNKGRVEHKVVEVGATTNDENIIHVSHHSYSTKDGIIRIGDDILILDMDNGVIIDSSDADYQRVE